MFEHRVVLLWMAGSCIHWQLMEANTVSEKSFDSVFLASCRDPGVYLTSNWHLVACLELPGFLTYICERHLLGMTRVLVGLPS